MLKNVKIVNLFLFLMTIFSSVNSMSPDLGQMKCVINDYSIGEKTPKETYKNSEKLNPDLQREIIDWLSDNKDWIIQLTQKSRSVSEVKKDVENASELLEKYFKRSSSIPKDVASNYVLIIPTIEQYILLMSSHYLRFLNLLEKHKWYTRPTLTQEQKDILNKELPITDTYQSISRAHYYNLFKKAKKVKHLTDIFAPKTYLVKLPWTSENRVADDTYIVVQELLSNLRPVDKRFINAMNYEKVRQMYEAVKYVGIWNIKGNWYIDNSGHMYILGMQQQSKTSPDNYVNYEDPLLDRREGVKALASYFPIDSQQFNYLLKAIDNDPDLYCTDEHGNRFEKNFKKTLTKKVFEAHSKE